MLRSSVLSLSLVAASALSGCALLSSFGQQAETAPREQYNVQAVESANGVAVQVPQEMLNPDRITQGPVRYVVKRGDTLWDISEYFLKDPWLWPEVWYINPDIANPHLIYPGDVVTLIWVNGKPQLHLGNPDADWGPRVRISELDSPIPSIPLEAIRHFLKGARFLTPEQLATAPYVLAIADQHLVGGYGQQFYASRFNDGFESEYIVVHPGQTYIDPETREVLGQEGIDTAFATLEVEGEPATLRIGETFRETIAGDRLLPQEPEEFSDDIFLHVPDEQIHGQVAAHFDVHLVSGIFFVTTINRGSNHGVQVGTVFEAFKNTGTTRDPVTGETVALPGEFAGVMVAFRVEENVSHAIIMTANRQLQIGDFINTP